MNNLTTASGTPRPIQGRGGNPPLRGSPTQSDGVVEMNSSQGQPRRVGTGHATKSNTADEGMSMTRGRDVTLKDAGSASSLF